MIDKHHQLNSIETSRILNENDSTQSYYTTIEEILKIVNPVNNSLYSIETSRILNENDSTQSYYTKIEEILKIVNPVNNSLYSNTIINKIAYFRHKFGLYPPCENVTGSRFCQYIEKRYNAEDY